MKLDLVERFTLLSTLPQKGDIVTIKVLRNLKDALAASEQEIKEHGLREKDWEIIPGQGLVDIEINETWRGIIVDALKEADKNKAITDQHISLWEKFCEIKEEI